MHDILHSRIVHVNNLVHFFPREYIDTYKYSFNRMTALFL